VIFSNWLRLMTQSLVVYNGLNWVIFAVSDLQVKKHTFFSNKNERNHYALCCIENFPDLTFHFYFCSWKNKAQNPGHFVLESLYCCYSGKCLKNIPFSPHKGYIIQWSSISLFLLFYTTFVNKTMPKMIEWYIDTMHTYMSSKSIITRSFLDHEKMTQCAFAFHPCVFVFKPC